MSEYIFASGSIHFKSQATMDVALKPLVAGGWLKKGVLYSEGNVPASNVTAVSGLTLNIPEALYRNLGRVIPLVLRHADSGYFQFYQTHGQNKIAFWRDGESTCISGSEIAEHLNMAEDKDLFLINCPEEWVGRHGGEPEDYVIYRDQAISEVFEKLAA